MHARGKSENSTQGQPQALPTQPRPKSRQRLPSQLGETQFSQDFYFMPLDSPLSLIRPLSIKEAYGSRQLLLDLSSPASALPPTKARAASTPPGKTQPALPSDPASPPTPLGLLRLHRDTSTRVHNFKTRIENCFTQFHRDRKSQTEKSEEYIPYERIREKLGEKP